jgi:hypothetical protein
MTTQQQNIIDALTNEFARINKANATKKSFNLINTDALQERTKASKEFAELSKQDLAAWELAAFDEMERIIQLLVDDLPYHVKVERYDGHIGKIKSPKIQLRHESVSPCAHCDDVVSIEINVDKVSRINEYGEYQYFGEKLRYTTSATGSRIQFDTIEDAVGHVYFQDVLRKRVLR